MTGDAELITGVPRWYNFLPGLFPLAHFFTGVEAGGALGRDVERDSHHTYRHTSERAICPIYRYETMKKINAL